MAANPGSSLPTSAPAVPRKLDGRLRGRAQEWLTRKMALGFFPMPRTESDFRQRYHLLRELYAAGDGIRTELRKVPPSEHTEADRQLCERFEREVEEARAQQADQHTRAGIDALAASGALSPRVVINSRPDQVEIRIGPGRNPALLVIIPAWILVSWLILMSALLGMFGRGPMPWGPLGGLLVGVPFVAMLYFSTQYWLWIQGGTETITVSSGELCVHADLREWHGERTFRTDTVQHMRYSRPSKGQAGGSVVLAAAARSAPAVAFSCEGKTWRFGSDLDELSALVIIAALEPLLPTA